AIEVDYSTCYASPTTPALEALLRTMVQGMAAAGWSDAGTRVPGWLREGGFRDVDEGERPFVFEDEELAYQARYAADVMESALPALAALPGASEDELRAGLSDLRGLSSLPDARLGWVIHKSSGMHWPGPGSAGLVEGGPHGLSWEDRPGPHRPPDGLRGPGRLVWRDFDRRFESRYRAAGPVSGRDPIFGRPSGDRASGTSGSDPEARPARPRSRPRSRRTRGSRRRSGERPLELLDSVVADRLDDVAALEEPRALVRRRAVPD